MFSSNNISHDDIVDDHHDHAGLSEDQDFRLRLLSGTCADRFPNG